MLKGRWFYLIPTSLIYKLCYNSLLACAAITPTIFISELDFLIAYLSSYDEKAINEL